MLIADLKHGDRIQTGQTVLQVSLDEAGSEPGGRLAPADILQAPPVPPVPQPEGQDAAASLRCLAPPKRLGKPAFDV